MRSEEGFETEFGKARKELKEASQEYYRFIDSTPALREKPKPGLPREFWTASERLRKALDQVNKLLDERYIK